MLLKQVTYHTLNSTLGWVNPLFFVWKVPRPSPLDHHRQINAFLSLTWRCLASERGRWEGNPEAGTKATQQGNLEKRGKKGKNSWKNSMNSFLFNTAIPGIEWLIFMRFFKCDYRSMGVSFVFVFGWMGKDLPLSSSLFGNVVGMKSGNIGVFLWLFM